MMKFLRKHQKKLFIVISVMTIASFTFFGTYGTMSQQQVTDRIVGAGVDGSSISERDVNALMRFVSLPGSDFLKEDLMKTGLTALFAERHFEELQGEFAEKLDRAHHFTPHEGALQIWSRFVPHLTAHLHEVKTGDLSPKTFATYCQLYIDQVEFPPEVVSRIIQYHQRQNPMGDAADPRRIALFGAQTFDEWFGPQFTQRLGQFIYNAAIIAERKGYVVSTDEARAHLLTTCLQTLRSSSPQEVNYSDAYEFLRGQLMMTGVDESKAVKLWKKVMLVHRLFNDVGQGVLFDALSHHQFATFADENATVELYQLPHELRLTNFQALLKLHYYLDSVAQKSKNGLSELPRQFYAIDDVEKRAPELVVSRFDLEVSKVTEDEVAARIPLKEMWEFEVSDRGWEQLLIEFPILAKGDDRQQILDRLEPALRKKVDRYARAKIVDSHPEWVVEALAQAERERKVVAIRSKGAIAPFDEIVETDHLRHFLQEAPLGVEAPLYRTEQGTFYHFIVFAKPAHKEIMTFKEALENNWLGELVDRKLETAYPDVRKKDPDIFKQTNGGWRPFTEVRDQVGALVYSDYLKNRGDRSLNQFATERLVGLMEAAQKSVEAKGDNSPYLATVGEPLVDQWRLIQEVKQVKRSDTTPLSKVELFKRNIGEWSSVTVPHSGDLSFFKLMKREAAAATTGDRVVDAQHHLSTDAKRLLMNQLLNQIDESL